jgi:hypothetical protein
MRVAALVIVLLVGCGPPPDGQGSSRPAIPTPVPDFRDQARGICEDNADAIRGLAGRLAGEVTDANLVEQGTLVAGLAGVISTELAQLRSIPLAPAQSDQRAASAWFDELNATADAQVRAVSASANRELSEFRKAVEAAAAHWDAAGRHASAMGLRSCRPAALDAPS